MSANVIMTRLVITSWLLLSLCCIDSECVYRKSMCDKFNFAPSTHQSTQGAKPSSRMDGDYSSKPRNSPGSTVILILEYRPSTGPDTERRTHIAKRSTNGLARLVGREMGNSRTHTTRSQNGGTSQGHQPTTTLTALGRGHHLVTTPNPVTTSTLSIGTQTTIDRESTTHAQAQHSCTCHVSTSAKFSLYVIDDNPTNKTTGDVLEIADGCFQAKYSLKNLTSGPSLDFNNKGNDSLCPDKSGSDIFMRATHTALTLLLLFEDAGDDVKVRCGGQSSTIPPTKYQPLPNLKVIPHHRERNNTVVVVGREPPDTKAGRPTDAVSTLGLPLMILSFICLMLLMLLTALFLLWRRSKLDNRSSFHRRKTQKEMKGHEYNNYEEISEIYTKEPSRLKTEKEDTNPDIQRQVSTVSSKKTDLHSVGTSAEYENDYEDSEHSLQQTLSIPDGANVLSLEYSTAKDSISNKPPRPQRNIPSNGTSLNVGLASYEDLPYRHHPHIKISLTAENSTSITRSTPELLSTRNKSDNHERSKSFSGLSAFGVHSHGSRRNWLSRNSMQSGPYFELERRYNSGSTDVSKIALYESMLDTGNGSCASTCSSRYGITGHADGMTVHTGGMTGHRNSCRAFSKDSISLQPREEGPVYEDVTDDVTAEMVGAEISGTEKDAACGGVEKKEKSEKPLLKPRASVPNNPYIIDLSNFNKNPKIVNQSRSSSLSAARLPNTTNCRDNYVKTPNPDSHTVSDDNAKQSFLSPSNQIPPRQAYVNDNHEKGYHDDDDGVVMIENDIYRTGGSHLQGEDRQSSPSTITAGNGSDSGITLNDHDDEDGNEDSPCGNNLNILKATSTEKLAMPCDKGKGHMIMIPNSIYQSTTGKVEKGVDVVPEPFTETTECEECSRELVLMGNSIYQSTKL